MDPEPDTSRTLYDELLGLPAPAETVALSTLARDVEGVLEGFDAALHDRLARAGVVDVPAAVRAVLSLAEDPLSRDRFVAVLSPLLGVLPRCADPDMALRNLARLARAVFDHVAFYGLLHQHPVLVRFLVDLLSFSEFLSDILIRNPEYLEWLLTPERLDADPTRERIGESLRQAVSPFRKPETIRRALCRWKRREVLRIGVRDRLGKADIRQCARELSWLAEAVVGLALDQAKAECSARFGEPCSEYSAPECRPARFAVYGMGKLGGEDLNFSSDIDLIFVYDEEGRTSGVADSTGAVVHRITNHEYYTKLGERIVAFLSEPSDEGNLFRVDMRLRPEGKTGPLVRSLPSYMSYFSDQARPWEKVAYLKARRVAGDDDLAVRFDAAVAHFVYSDPKAETLAGEMTHLKSRIDREVLEGDLRRRDLKRGVGGIREIEFVASYRQILEGGRDPAVRTRDTAEALRRLGARGTISVAYADFLIESYFFLRRLEHRIQMMAERQTYLVPDSVEEWGRLARRNGDAEGDLAAAGRRLQTRFQETTHRVRAIFEEVFDIGDAHDEDEASLVDLLLRAGGESDSERALRAIADAGFLEPPATLRSLRELAYGTSEMVISSTGQRWFEKILPSLLEQGRRLPFPDAAVRSLDAFLRAAKGRALLYEMLAGNPPILRLLLTAFASGPVMSRSLIAHPEWFDEILDTGVLSPEFDIAGQEDSLGRALAAAPDDDAAWRRLRRWKEKTLLMLGLLETLDIVDEQRLARMTSDLADICLRAVADRLERRLLTSSGVPRPDGRPEGEPLRWTLLGLGGFGGRHVSHYSDLDFVLIYSEKGHAFGPDGAEGLKASHWYSRLGEEIIGVMTGVSPDGQLFKVDARLRPEGRNAPLAATVDRYLSYYEEGAQTWEWQAILRARRVAGDEGLAARFLGALWERVPAGFADGAALAAEVRSMRERLAESSKPPRWAESDYKRGHGGLVDVDFILQFLQLKTLAAERWAGGGGDGAALRLAVPETETILARLVEAGALSPEDEALLRGEHDFLRTLQRRARLLFETSRDFFPEKPDRLEPLRRALASRLPEGVDLVERFHAAQRRLRDAFERLVR